MEISQQQGLRLWLDALAGSVRGAGPDLTARQMAILMTIYLDTPPHTVRGLAARLTISKPAVTRALDRLTGLDFVRRRTDPEDRRNVLVNRTVAGSVFLNDFAERISAAGDALR